MKLIKNLSVPTRKYTDRDGKDKAVWRNIGAIWKDDKGEISVSFDRFFNFAALTPSKEGSDMVFIRAFDPKPKDNSNAKQDSYSNSNANDSTFDDGLAPF